MHTANPGFHHVRVGDAIVTALNDGVITAPFAWLAGVPAEEAEAMLQAEGRATPPRISVSAFLVTIGGRRILVDTAGGTAMGPDFGKIFPTLASLGVATESIDTILLTHAHVDHASGLLDDNGAARFIRAELVMHAAELAFWSDPAIAAAAPEARRASFATAGRCLEPYRDRIRTVTDGAEAVPGILACHLPGHTPGHCGWQVVSGGASLLIWGDVTHIQGIQFARPAAGMAFDVDQAQAAATRARTFDMAATDRLLVAGMHLDFPAFGHVARAGAGYAFVPEMWQPAA